LTTESNQWTVYCHCSNGWAFFRTLLPMGYFEYLRPPPDLLSRVSSFSNGTRPLVFRSDLSASSLTHLFSTRELRCSPSDASYPAPPSHWLVFFSIWFCRPLSRRLLLVNSRSWLHPFIEARICERSVASLAFEFMRNVVESFLCSGIDFFSCPDPWYMFFLFAWSLLLVLFFFFPFPSSLRIGILLPLRFPRACLDVLWLRF